MGLDTPAKRRRDRDRARAWLARDPGRLAHVLMLAFRLQPGQEVHVGMTGQLVHLRPLDREEKFLSQGLAALLVGERWVRPVPTAATGPERPGQYSRTGVMVLGPVTLTRPGLAALAQAGHPATDHHPGG